MAGPAVLGRADAAAARRHLARARIGRRSAVTSAGGGVGRLGAVPVGDGLVEFRVWAPTASRVTIGGRAALEPEGGGVFAARLPAPAGDDYRFVLDGGERAARPVLALAAGGRARPVARRRHGRVRVDGRAGRVAARRARDLRAARRHVHARGHVRRRRPAARRAARARRDRDRADAGRRRSPASAAGATTACYTSAPHRAYGGPDGLARLVDAAHAAGLGVILDVVYNHIGPAASALRAFGPYFTDRHETFWGDAINYAPADGVREWAIQNAEHVGARLPRRRPAARRDARDLRRRARGTSWPSSPSACGRCDPDALVISEMETGDLRPIEEWGHDAQWADELHHELHVLLTGERDGYYERLRHGRRPRAGLRARAGRAARASARRTTTRSATARSATGLPPAAAPPRARRACSSRRRRRCSSWARSTASAARSSSSPTTSTRAIAEATREGRQQRVRALRRRSRPRTSPTRRRRETFERSKLDPRRGRRRAARVLRRAARACGASCRARSRRAPTRSAASCACAAATSSSSPTSRRLTVELVRR